MLKQEDYIKAQLVEMSYRFGKKYGGYVAGQLIMCAIANRVRCGWGSWLQMLDRVPVYMAENSLPELEHPSVWDAGFVKLLHSVDGIYDGSTPDMSKGALYWADLAHVERDWFKEKVIQAKNEDGTPVHPRVVDMGSLSFWR